MATLEVARTLAHLDVQEYLLSQYKAHNQPQTERDTSSHEVRKSEMTLVAGLLPPGTSIPCEIISAAA